MYLDIQYCFWRQHEYSTTDFRKGLKIETPDGTLGNHRIPKHFKPCAKAELWYVPKLRNNILLNGRVLTTPSVLPARRSIARISNPATCSSCITANSFNAT